MPASIHWFRKGLRLHDNPALVAALAHSPTCFPLFVIDPVFATTEVCSANRYNFMLECLADIDASLRARGSRLFVARGNPAVIIPQLAQEWGADLLTYESDIEPYALERDAKVTAALEKINVTVQPFTSHTLFDPNEYHVASGGKLPNTYKGFLALVASMGKPRRPLETPLASAFAPLRPEHVPAFNDKYSIPSLAEMGYTDIPTATILGGETEALRRLDAVTAKPTWVSQFDKFKTAQSTAPAKLETTTTVLSAHLKFGCLSTSYMFYEIEAVYEREKDSKDMPSTATTPASSLRGQILWRDFFYMHAAFTPNFDKMVGNPYCKQIPWEPDQEKLKAWREARTGFPFIDAVMKQLIYDGWIHHLARHAVACFLTRGDLWQNWEDGAKVFDQLLLDSDWALNNANWQFLSCSRFSYQFYRIFSPVAFAKKTDPNGDYVRKWIPSLINFPAKYIYEPWKAPLSVQREAGCVIGRDYPRPICVHEIAAQEHLVLMKAALAGTTEEPCIEESPERKNPVSDQSAEPEAKRRREDGAAAADN